MINLIFIINQIQIPSSYLITNSHLKLGGSFSYIWDDKQQSVPINPAKADFNYPLWIQKRFFLIPEPRERVFLPVGISAKLPHPPEATLAKDLHLLCRKKG
jgi:hypothetical protein